MAKTEQELATLGDERPTSGHRRLFLSHLTTQYHNLTTSALNGTYHETDSVFFSEPELDNRSTRLRATVHRLNTVFSDYMRDNGQKRKIRKGGLLTASQKRFDIGGEEGRRESRLVELNEVGEGG